MGAPPRALCELHSGPHVKKIVLRLRSKKAEISKRLLQVAEQLKNTSEIPEKTSKNRFPLYFVWDKKPTKKPKNFRPGPELKTVFIALEMKFAMTGVTLPKL